MAARKPFGSYAIALERRRAHMQRQKAVMADLVSEGWTITAVARHLGLSQQMGSKTWRQIVDDMGAQAV